MLAFVADVVLIALGTVYTQHHHAFDALTGFVVVLVLQCAVTPLREGRQMVMPGLISRVGVVAGRAVGWPNRALCAKPRG